MGDWNDKGQKHGMGHLVLSDSTRYDGGFEAGLFNGLGVISFPDGARYFSGVTCIPSLLFVFKLEPRMNLWLS